MSQQLQHHDLLGLKQAIEQARRSLDEGGIPIGAALVRATGGSADEPVQVIGCGHNRRLQENSPILHAEIDALKSAGRLGIDVYRECTMVSSFSSGVLGLLLTQVRLVYDAQVR